MGQHGHTGLPADHGSASEADGCRRADGDCAPTMEAPHPKHDQAAVTPRWIVLGMAVCV